MVLDCKWNFQGNLDTAEKEAIKRSQVLNEVGNSTWGLESRVLAIATHALPQSVPNYGPPFVGTHVGPVEMTTMGGPIINKQQEGLLGPIRMQEEKFFTQWRS